MQEGKQKTQKPQKHKPQNQKTNPTQPNTKKHTHDGSFKISGET